MLKTKTFFAPARDRVEQGQRQAGFDGVHPFDGRRRTGNIVDHNGQHQHYLHRQHVIARQRQYVGDETFIGQHTAQPFTHGRFHRREFPGGQQPGVKCRAEDKQHRAGCAHQTEIILQQPAAEQGANHRTGAVLHHQQ
ncbi:hypothetical protein D3C71_1517580 [compost metagenome]